MHEQCISTDTAMLRSDALKHTRHGFFTRTGGVSEGIYASRNCGFGSRDDPALVRENRASAMAAIDLAPEALVTVYQVHGAEVAVAEAPWRPDDVPRVDALVTGNRDVALGILTADCAPILFAAPRAGVVGAAHAGWRGALAGVIEATVAAMNRLGAANREIVAVIGPCIAQASYEVGPEFPQPFLARDAAHRTLFRPSGRLGHHQFDLPGYIGRPEQAPQRWQRNPHQAQQWVRCKNQRLLDRLVVDRNPAARSKGA